MPAAKVAPVNSNINALTLQISVDSSGSDGHSLQDDVDENENREENLSRYQRALKKLQSNEKWQKDIAIGKRIGFYRLKEELGTGNFSQVRSGVHTLTKERVAVKILDKSKLDAKTQNMLAREISSMESLHHPNVIRLFEVLETLSKIYLVMEHANGGELFHKISQNGRFTEQAAIPLFAQITAAVNHMHVHNIIHRDVKAENVFFSGPETVKVGDFGFSTPIDNYDQPLKTFCGSPPYAAPELFRDDSYVGPSVDIWAMGVLLYFMLTATLPFRAQTVAGLKKQILEGEYVIPEYLSNECHYLIVGLLKQDPKSRTTMDQVKKSNWLKEQKLPKSLLRDKFQRRSNSCEEENSSDRSLVDLAVRKTLKDFGINEDMVAEVKDSGSKSDITGVYRIVLHRALSELMPVRMNGALQEFRNGTMHHQISEKKGPKKLQVKNNKKSKMCVIL